MAQGHPGIKGRGWCLENSTKMSFLLHIPRAGGTGWVPAGEGPGRVQSPAQPSPAQPQLRLLPLPLTSSLCGFPLKGVGTSN